MSKDILFKIHGILAKISMNPNVYSEDLCDEVNTLLEMIYMYVDKSSIKSKRSKIKKEKNL